MYYFAGSSDPYESDDDFATAHPVKWRVERYKFRQLLDCNKLKKIIWYRKMWSPTVDVALVKLSRWIIEEFAKKKRAIQIQFTGDTNLGDDWAVESMMNESTSSAFGS